MFVRMAFRTGFTFFLFLLIVGCGGNKTATAPTPAGARFSTTLFDMYDASMIFGIPLRSLDPTGAGTFTLDESGSTLNFYVTFSFFFKGTFGEAKFHLPPMYPPGQTVRTVRFSEVTGDRIRGVWKNTDSEPLTSALVDSLINGKIFIEIVAIDSTGLDMGQLVPMR